MKLQIGKLFERSTKYCAKYEADIKQVKPDMIQLMQLTQLYHVDIKLQFVMQNDGELNILYKFELPTDKVKLADNLVNKGYGATMQVYGNKNILITPKDSFDNVILLANILTCKVMLGVMLDSEEHLKRSYKLGKVPAKSFKQYKWLQTIRAYLEQRIKDDKHI